MNVSKSRNSAAIDKVLGVKDSAGDEAPAEKSARQASPGVELTADTVRKYLQGTSAVSCGEIDALISSLQGLRERLVVDSGQLDQDISEFAALNQSVMRLTEVVADSVAHVQEPGIAE